MQLPIVAVQVTFEQDVVLSQANEYEVLQLLLGDMRDRLTSFEGAHWLEMATKACPLGSSLQASLADVAPLCAPAASLMLSHLACFRLCVTRHGSLQM